MTAPTCVHCGRKLKRNYSHERVRVEIDGVFSHYKRQRTGLMGYGYENNGFFCTMKCGWTLALKLAPVVRERLRKRLA